MSASSLAKTSFFTGIDSKTASTTTSTSPSSSYVSSKLIELARFHASSWVSRPLSTWYLNIPKTVSRAFSTASGFVSTTITGIPASAKVIAIPVPIVPPPITAAFAISSGWAGGRPGIFASSRSAKKTCRSAADGAERTSSMKSRASRASPRSNGISIAAWTASISLCAAKPPFSSGGTILCACATTNGVAKSERLATPSCVCIAEMRRFGLPAYCFAAATTSPSTT